MTPDMARSPDKAQVRRDHVTLIVNGTPVQTPLTPDRTLLRLLRDDLGLTGAKDGCSSGHCGACTVLVNGKARRACLVNLAKADGAIIETIEGLARGPELHPLQEAFIAQNAVQCGFCTPGMIMSSVALLRRNPAPTAHDIKRELTRNNNFCRCTGYVKIIDAIQDAAKRIADCAALEPGAESADATVLRRDAVNLVTGATRFADDTTLPGMLTGKVLWAAYPYAEILSIDTTAARAVPGVVAVFTAADIPGRNAFGRVVADQPAIADKIVRYIGDPVAVVFAETKEAAEAGRAAVTVEYRPLQGVFSPQEAAAPGAPTLHPNGNLLKESNIRRGDVEAAWPKCATVVEREFTTPFIEHAFLEPESGLAVPNADGGVTIHVPSQAGYEDRKEVAAILNLPKDKVRVIQLPIGGGFGGKGDVHLQRFLGLGALKLGRPVKITLTREESMRTHPKRHASWMRVKAGVDAEGNLLALQTRVLLDGGAYASLSGGILEAGCIINTGPYFVPNLDLHGEAWYTNNIIGSAMRGFGVPKISFAVESVLDELCRIQNLDPLAFRLRNALAPGLPNMADHVQEEGMVSIRETIEAAQKALAETEIPADHEPWRVGVGVAAMTKTVGVGRGSSEYAGARVELTADGIATVWTGYHEMGQGAFPTMLALAAEELGLPVDRVRIGMPDTTKAPETSPTTASRQTFMTGNAVVAAARELRGELAHRAADTLDAHPDDIVLDGPDLLDRVSGARLPLRELGESFAAEHQYRPPATVRLMANGPSIYGSADFVSQPTNWCYDYGTHVAIVEVNTETGQIRVLKYIAVHDVGKALNPSSIEAQVEGAVSMGLGYALSEEFVLKDGYMVTDTFAKCRLPAAEDTPEIVSVILEIPHPLGPHGAKGFAEAPTVPVAPAILNAVYDAMGVRITALPATPQRVLAGLKGGAQGA